MQDKHQPESIPENGGAAPPAGLGCRVELVLYYENGECEPLTVEIVPDEVADFKNGLLGESTPLANAINGYVAGDILPYQASDIIKVAVQSVTPGSDDTHREVIERRKAVLREAVRQSDLTNAIIFASAVNNKWGDYDPGAMAKELTDKP